MAVRDVSVSAYVELPVGAGAGGAAYFEGDRPTIQDAVGVAAVHRFAPGELNRRSVVASRAWAWCHNPRVVRRPATCRRQARVRPHLHRRTIRRRRCSEGAPSRSTACRSTLSVTLTANHAEPAPWVCSAADGASPLTVPRTFGLPQLPVAHVPSAPAFDAPADEAPGAHASRQPRHARTNADDKASTCFMLQ